MGRLQLGAQTSSWRGLGVHHRGQKVQNVPSQLRHYAKQQFYWSVSVKPLLPPISNDTGIFVSDIIRGGVVDSDGRLLLGDQILSINGEDVRAASQEHAQKLLQV